MEFIKKFLKIPLAIASSSSLCDSLLFNVICQIFCLASYMNTEVNLLMWIWTFFLFKSWPRWNVSILRRLLDYRCNSFSEWNRPASQQRPQVAHRGAGSAGSWPLSGCNCRKRPWRFLDEADFSSRVIEFDNAVHTWGVVAVLDSKNIQRYCSGYI